MLRKNLFLIGIASMLILGACDCPMCSKCCKKEEAPKAQTTSTEQTNVKALTTALFEESVKSEKLTVVKFWASWCKACEQMAPAYEKVATELKDSVNFYQVNVDEETSLAEKHEIKGIPTILFFKDGKQLDKITKALTEEELKEEITKVK
ncbi:MAG: thioredoxin family protein [bacterium]